MTKNRVNRLSKYLAVIAALVTLLGISASAHPVVLILSYLIHELGHIALARLVGGKIKKMSVGVFKLALGYDASSLPYKKELLVCIGGIIFNLVSVFVTLLLFKERGEILSFFITCNISLALINLYPVSVLDGGRILKLTLLGIFSSERAEKISNTVSFVCALVLWLFAVYLQLVFSVNISTFIISVFLLIQLCFSL